MLKSKIGWCLVDSCCNCKMLSKDLNTILARREERSEGHMFHRQSASSTHAFSFLSLVSKQPRLCQKWEKILQESCWNVLEQNDQSCPRRYWERWVLSSHEWNWIEWRWKERAGEYFSRRGSHKRRKRSDLKRAMEERKTGFHYRSVEERYFFIL